MSSPKWTEFCRQQKKSGTGSKNVSFDTVVVTHLIEDLFLFDPHFWSIIHLTAYLVITGD